MTLKRVSTILKLLFLGLIGACTTLDESEPPSISLFTLNGQAANTVLVLPDTLVVEALVEDERGLSSVLIAVNPLEDEGLVTVPHLFSIDSPFITSGTSARISKRLPIDMDSTFGGLYQVSFRVVDSDGNISEELSKGFQVINSKPELLLVEVPDALASGVPFRLGFQVRESSEDLASVALEIIGKRVTGLVPEEDDTPVFSTEFTFFEGTVFSFNESLTLELDTGKIYELNLTATDTLAQSSSWTTDLIVEP